MSAPEHVARAVTATTAAATFDTGPGGGWIPGDVDFVSVTSASSSNFVVLSDKAPVGKRIFGAVGANGFKLQTLAGSGHKINNVDTSSTAVAAIPANDTFLVVKTSATTWILTVWTNLGAVGTAIVPA